MTAEQLEMEMTGVFELSREELKRRILEFE
jgi:hypothetical protein